MTASATARAQRGSSGSGMMHFRDSASPTRSLSALVAATFGNGFVKNRVMEFAGPGVAGLSVEYRCGIDVMTTETTCLSSIWTTDDKVRDYLAMHGRADDYTELRHDKPACFDRCIRVDDVAVSHADAEKLMAEHETAVAALENALVQYERDHATTDNPDGHHD